MLLCIVLSLPAVALLRTLLLRERKKATAPLPDPSSPVEDVAEKLRNAIACKTVCDLDPLVVDWKEFDRLAASLAASFPLCFSRLAIPSDSPHNLIFRFEGSDRDALPALLTAHQDVVPANAEEWEHAPFGKDLDPTYVWGRGSFDCKLQLVAILQAFEEMLEKGARPRRTWYAAFGCDEEVNGGELGAARIAGQFERMGLRFSLVLDEGGAVAERYIDGIDRPIAVVGIAEKGYLDARLSCKKEAGHSSTPAFPTALGEISEAICNLERHRCKATFTPPVRDMLRNIGRQASFPYAFLFLNLWLTEPLLKSVFARNPTLNALIRTTVVPTVVHASDKNNVIAQETQAMVNARILPTETGEDVTRWIEKTVAKPDVEVTVTRCDQPSNQSPTDGEAFAVVRETIAETFPDAIVTPYLMLGATDARKYQNVSDNIYRFTPAQMDKTEIARMHAPNERISKENIAKAVLFFRKLVENW
jgi:carboxypeptidase PM20D1